MTAPICPYCGEDAELVGGKRVYPQRRDLYGLKFWFCGPCHAWTGTHANSHRHAPKGRLANKELREARTAAHAAFDPIWEHNEIPRRVAYTWLADQLDVSIKRCHIGWFDVDGCEQVTQVCAPGFATIVAQLRSAIETERDDHYRDEGGNQH